MSDENIYLDLIAERDRLKEMLNKIITQLYNVQAAFNKAEAEKAEAVKIAVRHINECCNRFKCSTDKQADVEWCSKICGAGEDKKAIESLTGKPWLEVGR